MSLRLAAAWIGASLLVTGCGTMANIDGRKYPLIGARDQVPPAPFGGMDRDLRWISSGGVVFIIDLPLSLVGDIVTLPKVLSATARD